MELNFKEGISSSMEITVTEEQTAAKFGSGDLEVFATPALVALMENTAKSCVGLHLPCGYTTVGIEIDVKHIRSSPLGTKIKCEAVLTKIEGKKLYFNVRACDQKGEIGKGIHIRYIVNTEEFMKKALQ